MNGATTPTRPALDPPTRLSTRSASELLAVGTGMGHITLRVADLDLMTRYYRDAVRLRVLAEAPGAGSRGASVVLGRRGVPIVVLEHAKELAHAGPREAGLYHTAIVFDTQEDLAAAVYSTATVHGGFTGSADHLVSEAFYFDDPEGNGVELYVDRPRSAWTYTDGLPTFGVDPLDPNQYLRTHLTERALAGADDGAAHVGHVHLSVGAIPPAEDFYLRTLGFEQVLNMGTALFVSAGGYHHHMAMNVWNSRGAGPRQLTLGLGFVRLQVPTGDDLGQLRERLGALGERVSDDGRTLRVDDPWSNRIEVTAAEG